MIIPINGLNVHFQVFGQGRPLLLLHGWGDSGENWYAVAERLGSSHQVFLLDLPGFGGSDAPPEPWGVDEYMQTVEAFIQEMELHNVLIVGHSHGGKVACRYVAGHTNCSGLILIASSGVDKRSWDKTLRIYFYKSMKLLLQYFGSTGEKLLARLREKMGSTDYRQAGSMRGTLVRVVNEKLFSVLPSIRVPTLILWGSEDKMLSVQQAKIFRRLLPDSYIRILWGASHYPHLDAPEELSARILEFSSAL